MIAATRTSGSRTDQVLEEAAFLLQSMRLRLCPAGPAESAENTRAGRGWRTASSGWLICSKGSKGVSARPRGEFRGGLARSDRAGGRAAVRGRLGDLEWVPRDARTTDGRIKRRFGAFGRAVGIAPRESEIAPSSDFRERQDRNIPVSACRAANDYRTERPRAFPSLDSRPASARVCRDIRQPVRGGSQRGSGAIGAGRRAP